VELGMNGGERYVIKASFLLWNKSIPTIFLLDTSCTAISGDIAELGHCYVACYLPARLAAFLQAISFLRINKNQWPDEI